MDFTIYSDDDFDVQITRKDPKYFYGTISSKFSSDSYLTFRLTFERDTFSSIATINLRRIMDIDHVFVPIECRGMKIADSLARKAFSIADNENMTIRPTCSYIRETFLARNPTYESQVERQVQGIPLAEKAGVHHNCNIKGKKRNNNDMDEIDDGKISNKATKIDAATPACPTV